MNPERAYRFGCDQHLVGIVGNADPPHRDVGVIVLNAGLVHRIGPFRLHVELTRALNKLGYPSLRMDVSTVGDSDAPGASLPHADRVRSDLRDAMALLATQSGCTRFVLIGLCSGAENAYIAACTEPDVAGAVFLDGYAYRTLGFLVRHYLPRIVDPSRIGRLFKRILSRRESSQERPVFAVEFPSRDQVRKAYTDMLERGLKLLFIYSGGTTGYFNHKRQFKECFGAVSRHQGLSLTYLKDSDHTYILAPDREKLINIIGEWLDRAFPASPGSQYP